MTPKERATALFMPDADCPHTFHFQERWANECITCIAGAISAARRDALEEAAQVCDRYVLQCKTCPYPLSCKHHGAFDVASDIRALIGRAPASAKEQP